MRQFWLGRAVPSAQVANLATPPQHRSRGYGGELLRGLFAELHDDGIPTVSLFASTGAFYRSVGFEYAGGWTAYRARAEHFPRTTAPYRARQIDAADIGEVRALYDRVAPTRHGAFELEAGWWDRFLRHDPVVFVLDGPDGPAGWLIATMRIVQEPTWGARIEIQDWGCLPGAEAALLGLLGGYGAMDGVVSWSGPDPDPALLVLDDPRFEVDRAEPWMLRVTDLPAALSARPYPTWVKGRVAFTVDDAACPWNGGDWTLEVEGGEGRLEKATAGGARAHPRALAALFTGYQDPAALAAASLLDGFSDADLGFLRAAFASPRPWTAEHY
jgi:predicted acetyltransferase